MSEDSLVLDQAYKQFSLETERLELAYHNLEDYFKNVQQTLQNTNTKLYGKLAELDFTTSYLDSILRHIGQGILFIDFNGIVTTYNLVAEEIFGIPESSLLFHPFWDHLPDSLFGFSLKEALNKKQAPKTTYISLNKEEKRELEIVTTFVTMSARMCPVDYKQDSSQLIQGLLILVRDMTEFRRLQVIAHRTDRLKGLGEMAALVAHEIRNPLGGIKGFATLLQQEMKDRPDLKKMVDQIISGTDHLELFVSKILNYTRPLQPHFELVDLISFMNEMLLLIQADSALQSNIQCAIETSLKSLMIPIDSQLLKSAILNLLINALQAMPQGGKLIIEIARDEKEAIIQIKDTGIGIPEEQIPKIFSPFFTTKETGNGLGLSEVYKVIQVHQGTIEVHSKMGVGTTFIITLPLRSL